MIFSRNDEKFHRIKGRSFLLERKYLKAVYEIVENVRKYGDKALVEYTSKFDSFDIMDNFNLSREDLKVYYDRLDSKLRKSLRIAADNIRDFHQYQVEKSFFIEKESGILLGQKITPLEKVSVYAPGGKASYPTSVLMAAIPAKIAGVKEVYLSTPTVKGHISDTVMAAAYIAGVDKVFRIGGAQAIAAFAYGSETIPKVDKIVGPGNIFVALAKKLVFGVVDVDMIAGPSEIIVIADEYAKAALVASDLIAQSEHDEMASAILITDSEKLAKEVEKALKDQIESLPIKNIVMTSLKDFGGIMVVDNIMDAFDISNELAPEHLEIYLKNSLYYLTYVKNAGAIFFGEDTPESVGDYIAGPNHILPTGGSSRFSSPLGTYDFIKRSSIVKYSRKALMENAEHIINIAESERLIGHARSTKLRVQE